jgi:hypothetical protein
MLSRVTVSLLFAGLLAGYAAGLDIADYDIVSIPLEVAKKDVPYLKGVRENVLHFRGTDVYVFLARNPIGAGDHWDGCGLDPETIRIEWLDEGHVMWIRWSTHPVGNGGHRYEGHAILKVIENYGIELHRTYFNAHSAFGAGNNQRTTCTFACKTERSELSLSRTMTTQVNSEEQEVPLYAEKREGGPDYHISRVTITETVFSLADKSLYVADVRHWIDLGDLAMACSELAERVFSVPLMYPCSEFQSRGWIDEDALKSWFLEEMKLLNQFGGDDAVCTGKVELPKVSPNWDPYTRNTYDGAFGLEK